MSNPVTTVSTTDDRDSWSDKPHVPQVRNLFAQWRLIAPAFVDLSIVRQPDGLFATTIAVSTAYQSRSWNCTKLMEIIVLLCRISRAIRLLLSDMVALGQHFEGRGANLFFPHQTAVPNTSQTDAIFQ